MSTFDPQVLEETIIDVPNATFIVPIPDDEYNGLIDDFKIRSVKTSDGVVPVVDVYWNIPDEKLQKLLDREKVIAKQSIWIDLDAQGSIAVGPSDNVGLGRLRAAVGLNKKGFSFPQLRGAGPARILVVQKKNSETGEIFSNVVKCVPIE